MVGALTFSAEGPQYESWQGLTNFNFSTLQEKALWSIHISFICKDDVGTVIK